MRGRAGGRLKGKEKGGRLKKKKKGKKNILSSGKVSVQSERHSASKSVSGELAGMAGKFVNGSPTFKY